MLQGTPIAFSGAPGAPEAPPAPYSAISAERRITAYMARMPRSSQPTPYASAFMAPPAWPMYMPSQMPRPPTQPSFMQAQFEELDKQYQDLEAPELEVQRSMSQTHNLNTLRDARVRSATSVRGSKHTRGQEQAPRHASSQLAFQTPSGAPL